MPDVGCINFATRGPVGVAGIIAPWNLPLYLLTFKVRNKDQRSHFETILWYFYMWCWYKVKNLIPHLFSSLAQHSWQATQSSASPPRWPQSRRGCWWSSFTKQVRYGTVYIGFESYTPSMIYNGHAIPDTCSPSFRLYKWGCVNHIREF